MTDNQLEQISNEIDELFCGCEENQPGYSVCVIRDGEIIHSKGYGSAQLEYAIPIMPRTIFHVASVSKQFAAMAAALLDKDGKINLDDDIREYLSYVPDFGEKITIRHLIHHTSGIRDQWELLRLSGWRMDDVITTDDILTVVKDQQDLNFEPGEKHLYSNTGYTMLAELVSEVSGKSFRQFTKERIFDPLRMNSTHFHDDHTEIVTNRAYSYGLTGDEQLKKNVLSYANVGATSLFTTAEDLAKWLMNFEHKRVGGSDVMEKMHQRFTLNDGETISYAFGLRYSEYRGLQVIGHSGADAGFRSFCGRFPEHNLGIVILSNFAQTNPKNMAMKVAEIFLEDKMEDKEEQTTNPKQTADISTDKLVGRYILEPLGVFDVCEDNDGNLTMQSMAGGPPSVLEPMGGLSFRRECPEAIITFETDETGDVNGFKMDAGSRTIEAEKYEPKSPDEQTMKSYAGKYFSPELQTTYEVSFCEDQLMIHHRRHGATRLLPLGENEFLSLKRIPGKVKFIQKDDGEKGMLITGGRVKNLCLNKIR